MIVGQIKSRIAGATSREPNDAPGENPTFDINRPAPSSCRIGRVNPPHDFLSHSALGNRDVVLALQIKPELRAVAEVAGKAECRIGGDRAAAVENAGDAARRHAEIERQAVGAQSAAIKLAAEQPSGMNCRGHV